MKTYRAAIRSIEIAGVVFLTGSGASCALGATSSEPAPAFEVVTTNWVQRALTNVIEVRVPKVVMVDEFRTNITLSFATNTIEVKRTVRVDQFKTNVTYSFQTNWVARQLTNTTVLDRYHTNVVENYTTNWLTRVQTNTLVVDHVRTNLLYAYHTNLTTLNVTNWETVLIMKTNWIKKPITNLVAIDVPADSPPLAAAPPATTTTADKKASGTEGVAGPRFEDTSGLMFEWSRPGDSQKEIVLTLKSANDSTTTLQVQEWRVEKSDATVLLMGRRAEFRGELPPGNYSVTVKARRSENSPILTLSGSIKVTPDAETHRVVVVAAN